MSFGASGGNGGRPGMMSDINVTPLVDVMLVLLIIFMVTAPMMVQGLDVNLPKVDATAIRTNDQQTVLTVRADGAVYLDEVRVPDQSRDNLAFQVRSAMEASGAQTVFLKADQSTPYGTVAAIMGQLQRAGITSLGLITDPADQTAAPARAEETRPEAAAPTAPRRPAGAN